MRIRPLIATVAVILGLALSSQAEARSRHERVKVEPIKKSGKVVGLRLKLTLRPQDYGHDRVKIGLAPTGGIAKAGLSGNFRDYASNRKKGFLFHQWKEVTGLKTGQPKEMT
ncbi:MAG: hypothetical protein KJO07_23190, partial [Deltaproteobacteria bacterium]|nr:hypothetical protein [Deltaproteobacteria bacterium]